MKWWWRGAAVYRSSFVIDGHRYACLADDAMISMRYALNLVNGNGLVWNPGQRVEGYTNPLMVMLMAGLIRLFGRMTAILVVQITGVLAAACAAVLASRLGATFVGWVSGSRQRLLSTRPKQPWRRIHQAVPDSKLHRAGYRLVSTRW